jgi:3-deoxy-D-manno-octulosonic-acid transferase
MPDIGVYIADTLGELGLMYRLGPIVFMGGSLASHGGQNPIEAIRLGAAIVHGPHVWNFTDLYAALDAERGAQAVKDEEALAAQLGTWLTDPAGRQAAAEAAAATVKKLSGALEHTWTALHPYLIQLRLEETA